MCVCVCVLRAGVWFGFGVLFVNCHRFEEELTSILSLPIQVPTAVDTPRPLMKKMTSRIVKDMTFEAVKEACKSFMSDAKVRMACLCMFWIVPAQVSTSTSSPAVLLAVPEWADAMPKWFSICILLMGFGQLAAGMMFPGLVAAVGTPKLVWAMMVPEVGD